MKTFSRLLQALTLLPFITKAVTADRAVFAHFMVSAPGFYYSKMLLGDQLVDNLIQHGLTAGYNGDLWRQDITLAQQAGIDGFALNIGPHDAWTEPQLDAAYDAADQANFKLLISFDQLCCGPWDVNEVSRIINKYKDRGSYYKVDGKPFVSTFEGTDFVDQWANVRGATGGIYLVPDWASLGPDGFKNHVGKVDGACKNSNREFVLAYFANLYNLQLVQSHGMHGLSIQNKKRRDKTKLGRVFWEIRLI